ncbi:MAG: hypothetical protein Q9P14_11545, partial [candidate division KSB1 bacterium]|nr:hypothetical protein [candidate division KSB1 bacterium]
VICRLFRFEEEVHSQSALKTLQDFADRLLAPEHPGDFNQAMMELGATICTRKPQMPALPGCGLLPRPS